MKTLRVFTRGANALRRLVTAEPSFSTTSRKRCEMEEIVQNYSRLGDFVENNFAAKFHIQPEHVFAVNQTNFAQIKIFGFDYDYTLAEYSEEMQEFIYRTAVRILVKKYKYPEELLNEPYIPDFCIRGLHYDIKRGLIMKIDERHIVQLDTVFRGRSKLKPDEAMAALDGTHLPKKVMDQSCFRGSENLQQLTDIFSLPEMLLLANVVEHFTKNKVSHDPSSVFDAVEKAVREVHTEGHLYKEVQTSVDQYLKRDCLRPLVDKLLGDGKRLFLLTNSRFPCVDVGMTHMLGSSWREAFEVVMVDAKKPSFFNKRERPFKTMLLNISSPEGVPVSWSNIEELRKGEVYCEGSCSELMRLKGWKGREVMYFGDQIYADLQTPNLSNGWYTCAVIHELKREIDVMNTEEFARNVVWVQTLEKLIERMQEHRDAESRQHVADWMNDRKVVKQNLKDVFNPRFGSVFRSALQGSYFSARLCRVADIYTSSVMNLHEYGPDKIFFPPRGSLPHEHLVSGAYQYDGFDTRLLGLQDFPKRFRYEI